jgi:2-keto-3-deoxy-galactonokinase
VKAYQTQLTEFLTTRKGELLAKIAKEKTVSDALAADLKSAADEFQNNWLAAHPQAKSKTDKPAAEKAQLKEIAK